MNCYKALLCVSTLQDNIGNLVIPMCCFLNTAPPVHLQEDTTTQTHRGVTFTWVWTPISFSFSFYSLWKKLVVYFYWEKSIHSADKGKLTNSYRLPPPQKVLEITGVRSHWGVKILQLCFSKTGFSCQAVHWTQVHLATFDFHTDQGETSVALRSMVIGSLTPGFGRPLN